MTLSAHIRHRFGTFDLDVAFDAGPGITALFGQSGAGKTTITYLLPRLYDPTSGQICLDGHDLRDVALKSLAEATQRPSGEKKGNAASAVPGMTRPSVWARSRTTRWLVLSPLPRQEAPA